MRKLLAIMTLLSSLTSMAAPILPKQCEGETRKANIETKANMHNKKVTIVHLYGETARELYMSMNVDETSISENAGKDDYIIKSQEDAHCFRQFKTVKKKICAKFECEIGVVQY